MALTLHLKLASIAQSSLTTELLAAFLGISLKTQEIYAIVFVARYLDLFTNHLSVYLTFMKIVFLCSTFYIIYLIRYQYNKSYSKQEDTFPRPLLLLVAPCAALSIFITAWQLHKGASFHITEVRPFLPAALISMCFAPIMRFSDL